jgi:hypothetical protein
MREAELVPAERTVVRAAAAARAGLAPLPRLRGGPGVMVVLHEVLLVEMRVNALMVEVCEVLSDPRPMELADRRFPRSHRFDLRPASATASAPGPAFR